MRTGYLLRRTIAVQEDADQPRGQETDAFAPERLARMHAAMRRYIENGMDGRRVS